MPSLGGKKNPKSSRTNPKENPAKGPAAATFRRFSRLGTIFTILVIVPKEPICQQTVHQNLSVLAEENQTKPVCTRRSKNACLMRSKT
ncbi:hypothetical protein ACFX2C_001455 [Malus domestica]